MSLIQGKRCHLNLHLKLFLQYLDRSTSNNTFNNSSYLVLLSTYFLVSDSTYVVGKYVLCMQLEQLHFETNLSSWHFGDLGARDHLISLCVFFVFVFMYVGPHKVGYVIVNRNPRPRRIYCQLGPKWSIFLCYWRFTYMLNMF